ncbi:MAG: phage portal protein [Propionibacteriales bacterium]|nr:phage portal protein [Propionibacteriales bacterium]
MPWNYGGNLSAAVTESNALRLVPVFGAVRLLSGAISTMPLQAYRKTGDQRVKVTDPALIRTFARGTLVDWLERLVTSLALHGNAYGFVTGRDGMGFVTNIEWLDPNKVSVDESNPLRPIYYVDGRLVATEDIVHIAHMVLPGRVVGLAPLDALRYSLSTGIGAAEYGRDWFANGGVPPGTFKNSQRTVNDADADAIKQRLVGSIKRGQPLVYGSEWDYNPIAIPPEQAQFIETHRLTATQIAVVFGIPPEMLGGDSAGSMTYSTVELNNLQYLVHTLRPWLTRIEEALSALLPNATYLKFNTEALLRTDAKTQFDIYKLQLDAGILSINEVRALMDLPPVDGGDEHAQTKPAPTPVRVVPNDDETPAPEVLEPASDARSLPAASIPSQDPRSTS